MTWDLHGSESARQRATEQQSQPTITLAVHRELLSDAGRAARRGRVSVMALLLAVAGAGLIGALLGNTAGMNAAEKRIAEAEARATRAEASDRQQAEQVRQLQSQLSQVREQITAHAEHATENPGEKLLLTGIGAALGIPAPLMALGSALVKQLQQSRAVAPPPSMPPPQAQIPPQSPQQILADSTVGLQMRAALAACGVVTGGTPDEDQGRCLIARVCHKDSDSLDFEDTGRKFSACGIDVRCWNYAVAECQR